MHTILWHCQIFPPGEDAVSFERHNRVLQNEWKKPSRNAMLVEQLMHKTFAMRRREIVENSCGVQMLFKKFPFLQDPEQVNNCQWCIIDVV